MTDEPGKKLLQKKIVKRIPNIAENSFNSTYLIYENILNSVCKFVEFYKCKKVIQYTNCIKYIDNLIYKVTILKRYQCYLKVNLFIINVFNSIQM